MRFRIPGQNVTVRMFHPVETVDTQYNIVDCGIEQEDGSIDSIAVGGSFSYAKSLMAAMDRKKDEQRAEAANNAAPAAWYYAP